MVVKRHHAIRSDHPTGCPATVRADSPKVGLMVGIKRVARVIAEMDIAASAIALIVGRTKHHGPRNTAVMQGPQRCDVKPAMMGNEVVQGKTGDVIEMIGHTVTAVVKISTAISPALIHLHARTRSTRTMNSLIDDCARFVIILGG